MAEIEPGVRMPISDMVVIGATAFLSVAFAAWWLLRHPAPAVARSAADNDVALLFEDGVFSHASDAAALRFDLEPGVDEWEDFQNAVMDLFPQFPARPQDGSDGAVTLMPADSTTSSRAHVSWQGPLARVVISDHQSEEPTTQAEPETQQEVTALQRMNACLPDPVWQTNEQGKVIWHNPAYASLCASLHEGQPKPDAPLFDLNPADMELGVGTRIALTSEADQPQWFSVFHCQSDGVSVFCASNIDPVVKAEETQRNFVQTLAKTFAHLSIGLAIFDRKQQLVLFNPALVDLTGLQAEFLSGRPNILTFFDRLREHRRMPEPKNYQNWRQTISDLITAAADGRYQETWSLESGQTFRVTGRPHPDGATAFLIEDISAEVTLTRNFRAELELGQSLLDTLDEGLAVFSASGVQTFSNKAYQNLWRLDPDASFADVTLNDSIRAWKLASRANGRWREIEDFVLSYGDRRAWDMHLTLKDGRTVVCHLMPIVSGATLIRFRISTQRAKAEATTPA